MSRFNTNKATTKTKNLAGGRAYKHSSEMELIVSVLNTFLENKHYENAEDRISRIKDLVKKVKPEFVAKLAVLAREKFYLRSVTTLLVAELARNHRGDSLVSKTIARVAQRPDDLTELVSLLGHPIPKQVKLGINLAFRKFNEYQLAKYKQDSKKVKLVDLLNLVHPKPANKEQEQLWKDLLEGKLKNTETWESMLSAGKDKGKVWEELITERKIGYMALLRNLRNIEKAGDPNTISRACVMISNPEDVAKSKQLPFRFFNAYENVSNQAILTSISIALEHSLGNVPKFEGKTLIAVDGSGSMDGDPIKKASLFASALFKSNDAELIIYDTGLQTAKMIKTDSLLTLAEKIQKTAHGGGTETSLVFRHAMGNKYDRIIILSDNESWNEYRVQSAYEQYRKENDCFVYAIDLAGYGTKDITSPKVFHLCGWSDQLFNFMSWIEKENDLIKFVEEINL